MAATLLVMLPMAQAAAPACPKPGAALVERFIDADCESCWAAADKSAAGWRLDWVLPNGRGDDAALAVGALSEGSERQQRAGAAAPAPESSSERLQPLAGRGPGLTLQSGPAWNGYLALMPRLQRKPPTDASLWLAIVEEVEAGGEGNAAPRSLVRSVAGPYRAADWQGRIEAAQIIALRVPNTPRPQRLAGRAWLEDSQGRIVAMASDACPRKR